MKSDACTNFQHFHRIDTTAWRARRTVTALSRVLMNEAFVAWSKEVHSSNASCAFWTFVIAILILSKLSFLPIPNSGLLNPLMTSSAQFRALSRSAFRGWSILVAALTKSLSSWRDWIVSSIPSSQIGRAQVIFRCRLWALHPSMTCCNQMIRIHFRVSSNWLAKTASVAKITKVFILTSLLLRIRANYVKRKLENIYILYQFFWKLRTLNVTDPPISSRLFHLTLIYSCNTRMWFLEMLQSFRKPSLDMP